MTSGYYFWAGSEDTQYGPYATLEQLAKAKEECLEQVYEQGRLFSTSGGEQNYYFKVNTFLEDIIREAWTVSRKTLLTPQINTLSDGSIDLHWKTGTAELLINVPVNPATRPSFYGDNTDGLQIKGQLKLTKEAYLLLIYLGLYIKYEKRG